MAGEKGRGAKASPIATLAKQTRHLVGDARGAALIEFAMIAGPLFALLIAIVETSIVFLAQQSLETAAEAAARTLMTGQAQKANLTQAQFKASACAVLPPPLKCSNLMIDVETASTFSAVDTTKPTISYDSSGNVSNTWNYTPGGAQSIVIMRLLYVWPVSLGPLGFNLANSGTGKRLLVATSVFQTEPYA
ncbi:MAG: pilus assembly protein [Sphingomonadaceae bacterium]|nr:pilus assembly protein [Sphingomonadaceae bacterium]